MKLHIGVFRNSNFQKQKGSVTNWKGKCKQQKQKEQQQTQEGISEKEDRSISSVIVETESNNMEWMATNYQVQENYKIMVMGKYVPSDKKT